MEYIVLPFLIALSGLMSGLIIAILGLDKADLQRKAKLGDLRAQRILPLRDKDNWVLCSLMISSVAFNAAISMIFADSAGSGIIAFLLSTVFIFIFSEILPQAVCNVYKMEIGSFSVPIVKAFMYITSPASYPVGKLFDLLLKGKNIVNFSRLELQEIINESPEDTIDSDEKNILIGGLNFSKIPVIKVMTPVNHVYSLEIGKTITFEELKKESYTRIPVYEGTRDNVVGILYLKDLVGVKGDSIKVSEYVKRDNLIKIKEELKLDLLLNLMTTQKTHISFIYDDFGVLRGIVTLEDIIETIISREIMDEYDSIADINTHAKKSFNLELVLEEAKKYTSVEEEFPWGTYGKGRNGLLSWVKLCECSTEHLYAILTTQPHVIGSPYEYVIKRILDSRKIKEKDDLSEKNGYFTPQGVPTVEQLLKK